MSLEASLYVHVPFCAQKCGYCDFYSVPVKPPNPPDLSRDPRAGDPGLKQYVKTLLAEGEGLFERFRPSAVPSVYIGGGTPSLLGPGGIGALLGGLSKIISRYSPPPVEITVEANPESADEAFMEAARKAGATRFSLGIQSFSAASRRAIGRAGEERFLSGCLALAAAYFPGSFSVDLISGLPLQGRRDLLDDIAKVLDYSPAHVSLYALTVEAGTPLAEKAQPEAEDLGLEGRDALERAGYAQYEVSNFCLKGKESLHNIRYWRMQSWLALGPSASATVIDDNDAGKSFRYTIPPDVDTWLAAQGNPVPIVEKLDKNTLIKESLLMGFRYLEGPDEDLFLRRFGRSIRELITGTMNSRQGHLKNGKCALTKDGLLFLNSFLVEAFQELDLLK